MEKLKHWWVIVRDSFKRFFNDNPFRYSATIAYYAIFSMPGIAILTVMVAGQFYEYDEVRNELINQVRLFMGQGSAEQVKLLMSKAYFSADSAAMKIIGAVSLVFSATTVFSSLQDSINSIWRIKPKPRKEILKFAVNRLLSLAMIVSIGFLMLISLMADTLIAILKQAISDYMQDVTLYLAQLINLSITLVIVTFVFAAIFKVLPDAQIRWRDVWAGAIVTTILFIIGKFLIGFYLGNTNMGDAYGAAGSLVVLLSWVYYSVVILLFGAQFTFVYNKENGRAIRPNKEAVAIRIEEVERGREAVTRMKE